MVKTYNYKGIVFDDVVKDQDGHLWSQICLKCVEKYNLEIKKDCLSDAAGFAICGVKDCNNENEYYIDF